MKKLTDTPLEELVAVGCSLPTYREEIMARFEEYRGDSLTLNAFCLEHGRTPSMMASQCEILRNQLKALLISHYNLYKMAFGEGSEPNDDMIRRNAAASLEREEEAHP